LFVNFAGGDFRLASATAAGDSSISSQFNGDLTDMNGLARGTDGLWDRGAFEFSSSQSQLQPPSGLQAIVR
jgi:hypothetical protein